MRQRFNRYQMLKLKNQDPSQSSARLMDAKEKAPPWEDETIVAELFPFWSWNEQCALSFGDFFLGPNSEEPWEAQEEQAPYSVTLASTLVTIEY